MSEKLHLESKLNARLLNVVRRIYYESERKGPSNEQLVKQLWFSHQKQNLTPENRLCSKLIEFVPQIVVNDSSFEIFHLLVDSTPLLE